MTKLYTYNTFINNKDDAEEFISIDYNYSVIADISTRWSNHSSVVTAFTKSSISLNDNSKKFDNAYIKNNVNNIYRFSNLSLSRDKLAIYQEKVNFKITRDRDLADVCIVSEKFFEKELNGKWGVSVNKNTMVQFYEDIMLYDRSVEKTLNTIKELDDNSLFICNSNYFSINSINGHIKGIVFETNFEKSLQILKKLNSGQYHYTYKDYAKYQWLTSNQHKLMLDTDLNKLCTGDSVTLTVEDFERLEQLLSSTDVDNVSVGLTLMANCNVAESKTFLSILFSFYSDFIKNNKIWNQVNFKYLRKEFSSYIDISPTNWGHAYDTLIKQLIKDDCLTVYASRYIANKMFIGVLQNNFGVGSGCVFTIDKESLQLKEEYKNELQDSKDESENISNIVKNAGQSSLNAIDLPF